jgi:hypothetical protein
MVDRDPRLLHQLYAFLDLPPSLAVERELILLAADAGERLRPPPLTADALDAVARDRDHALEEWANQRVLEQDERFARVAPSETVGDPPEPNVERAERARQHAEIEAALRVFADPRDVPADILLERLDDAMREIARRAVLIERLREQRAGPSSRPSHPSS